MIQTLHDLDLSEKLLQTALIELGLVNDLDSNLFAYELMFCEFHLGKVALSDRFYEPVLANVGIIRISRPTVGAPVGRLGRTASALRLVMVTVAVTVLL
jgi:hypothetical protein